MNVNAAEKLSPEPEEMLAFTVESALQRSGPRLGTLACKGRIPISTPNYIPTTSRGVVPHLSQDNIARHTKIQSMYFGLEDFIEKQPPLIPPIYEIPAPENGSRLRTFTAHAQDKVLILGPRRFPALESPLSNADKKLAICTSVGFRQLDVDDYLSSAATLTPDIFLAAGDIVTGQKPSQKRAEKMGDRTAAWLRDAVTAKVAAAELGHKYSLFAPILPLSVEMQQWYLMELVEDFRHSVDGLYVHDAQSVVGLPDALRALPRIALTPAMSPKELLYQISLGVDLFVTSFTGSATDAGVALTFNFPGEASQGSVDSSRRAIGIDLWDTVHATDVSPLLNGCSCYACRNHHRAYVHHLLSAKEMLAWVLLQIHNHHVMERFFSAVRMSIGAGTFEAAREDFEKQYESELPVTTGSGPRVRGYQIKSAGGGERKKNVKAFNKLDDMAGAIAENEPPGPNVDAQELESHGLGKQQ
ncbi:uncharacterized protein PV09_01981 [Verruconis gallopava]|uniref:Queuine tRNA-ribosyltransferase accessory subunit 2 n=1 Tax=Verruconis gallopava TaxID=253628 RepID=A0A0D2AJR0_9PEZI|nr:uncharacterized protein PV09_01981 [Verruconis gallopava]KIW07103.1 hypothetical protein PV09_01981 [Verruconis gallopava]